MLQVRDRLLILPIIGVIDPQRARQLTEQLLRGIRANRAKVVVVDITGVPSVDATVANHLVQTVDASRLMGANVIVTGLSSEIAQTLVTIGVDLGKINAVGDLQGGIEEAERLLGYKVIMTATGELRRRKPEVLRAMRVPILKQGDYLIASIQSALNDEDLLQLQDDLAAQVGSYRSRGAIVDVTVLDVMDSFAVRTLRAIAHMIRLRGAETVIVGIQPEVAFAMVQLGLTLEDVATALDLEEGLAYLDRSAAGPASMRSERCDPSLTRAPAVVVPIASAADVVTARQRGREPGGEAGVLGERSDRDRHRHLRAGPQHPRVRRDRPDRGGRGPAGAAARVSRWWRATAAPGSPTSTRAMQDGYSTGNGLGLGLPGVRRLMDEFSIVSAPGQGTSVTVRKWTL